MEIIFSDGYNDIVFRTRQTERHGWTYTALLDWQQAAGWSTLIQDGIKRAKTPSGFYELDLSKTTVKEGPAMHVWVTVPIVREIKAFKTFADQMRDSR